MEKVFLSFSYRPEDQALVRPVISFAQAAVEAHGARVIIGDALGGGPLTAAIMALIEECDALIAFVTPDQARQPAGYTPHPFVRDELNHARSRNRRSIALMHKDVVPDGAWQEHEYIRLDVIDPLPALTRLMKTLGKWQREDGRTLRIMLLPEDIAYRVVTNDRAICQYRLLDGNTGNYTEWKAARVAGQIGGSFAYVPGARDDSLVEIRVELGRQRWRSRAAPQFMRAELSRGDEEP